MQKQTAFLFVPDSAFLFKSCGWCGGFSSTNGDCYGGDEMS